MIRRLKRGKYHTKGKCHQHLAAHQAELKELGVDHLTLFGSVARGEAGPDSDVDLLANFDEAKALSLLTVVGIQQ